MTDIEAKALALVNEVEREEGEKELTRRIMRGLIMDEALCRAIEQHEAFKQEVSDAVESALLDAEDGATIRNNLGHFIIPKPKPDPLVEVMKQAGWADAVIESCAPSLSAALDARGLEIREKGQ
jgi:hypothetical protein